MRTKRSQDTSRWIPVLAYHEIGRAPKDENGLFEMTPYYFVSPENFEEQLKEIANEGYENVSLEDLRRGKGKNRNILFTFDDGWEGNLIFAMPLLKKYKFKGIVFVTGEYIGQKGKLGWDEARELSKNDMMVQSHGMTHRPIACLNDGEIARELRLSKELIEREIGKEVYAISFPHGSYNENTIRIGKEIGYKFMFTSDIKYNCIYSFRENPAVIGRLMVRNNTPLKRMLRLIKYEPREIILEMVMRRGKNLAKQIMGMENYRKLYRRYFNIKLKEKGL